MSACDTDHIELTGEQIASIRAKFERLDSRDDGHVPVARLGEVMRGLGHRLSRRQLEELGRHVDPDGSGTIKWEEFLSLLAAKVKEQEEQQFYKNLFRMLDKRHKGFIRCYDLRAILQDFAKEVDLTTTEIDAMIAEVDEDRNGEVSFDEFFKLMTSE